MFVCMNISSGINSVLKFSPPQDELSSIKNQLSQGFSPDDAYTIGPPLFMETPRPCSPLARMEIPDFDEVKHAVVVFPSSPL